MKKFLSILILVFLIFFSGCGQTLLPTENGIRISIIPNPVSYDTERDGWYFTVSLENLGPQKVYLTQANITGSARFLIFSFDLPEEVFYAEDLEGMFGTSEIEPYGTITWEKGLTYQEVQEMIASYENYPGVSVDSLMRGLKLQIHVYGQTEDGTSVDAFSGDITFLPRD